MNSRTKRYTNIVVKNNQPKPRCVFSYTLGNGCYRWGSVVSEYKGFGLQVPGFLLYLFDAVSQSPDEVPHLASNKLVVPPIITNTMPWKRGVFRNVADVCLQGDQVMQRHCLWSPESNSFWDEHDNRLSEMGYPCGLRMLIGLQGIEELILVASMRGCWDGEGMWALWPPANWQGLRPTQVMQE